MQSLAFNKRASHDFEILEKFEAGIVLTGAEVKSLRSGNATLQGAYVTIARGELWLMGAHIGKLQAAGVQESYDPTRTRKLLVHKKELLTLVGKTQEKGLTLVPFALYPRGRQIKLSFGLCRGRKAHDKREKLKARDLDREQRQSE